MLSLKSEACTTCYTCYTCCTIAHQGGAFVAEGEETTNKSIRDVNVDLWLWLKMRAVAEGKAIGEKLNEILADAREQYEPDH